MVVKHNCSDCIYRNDFLAPCDWLTRQKILVLNCQHYKKARNPWKRTNDVFSALCDKKEGAEDGK